MKQLDFYQLLDDCLALLYRSENKPNEHLNGVTQNDFKELYSQQLNSMSSAVPNQITNKLIKDGYIVETGPKKYNLTVEGFLFIQDGKYKRRNAIVKKRQFFQDVSLFLLSFAAFATMLYYSIEIVKSICLSKL